MKQTGTLIIDGKRIAIQWDWTMRCDGENTFHGAFIVVGDDGTDYSDKMDSSEIELDDGQWGVAMLARGIGWNATAISRRSAKTTAKVIYECIRASLSQVDIGCHHGECECYHIDSAYRAAANNAAQALLDD